MPASARVEKFCHGGRYGTLQCGFKNGLTRHVMISVKCVEMREAGGVAANGKAADGIWENILKQV